MPFISIISKSRNQVSTQCSTKWRIRRVLSTATATSRSLPLLPYSHIHHTVKRHFSGQDDGWIPPIHSPLYRAQIAPNKFADQALTLSDGDMAYENDTDEIEVIDLEATLTNPNNREYLEQLASSNIGIDAIDDKYTIESSDSDWDEVLKELKDAGQNEKVRQIVEQFGLHDTFARMEKNSSTQRENDLESSFEHLLENELIDELIENSATLTQLEMEILSQEISSGLDVENDRALSDNTAYIEFRKMVLEDYHEEQRINSGKTDTTLSSEYSHYPQDWKDYDSHAAFSRDFLDQDDSWVPPVKDFVPSKSSLVSSNSITDIADGLDDFDNSIDWLQARRSRLDDQKMPSQMLTPGEAESFRHENSQIPVIPFTLLTTSEISASISSQGGKDIHIIDTREFNSTYGVSLDCDYLMIVTGRNSSHIRVMAESVVRNLKDRNLHERGIVGAMKGPEGGQDIFSNKPARKRASRNGLTNISAKIDDDWMVVDCGNIHVHILEAVTRKCLNIESLWDLSDPNSEGSKLRRLDFENEDDIDTYVAENPIPEEYAKRLLLGSSNYVSSDFGGRVHKLSVGGFERKSYSGKWGGSKPKRRRR